MKMHLAQQSLGQLSQIPVFEAVFHWQIEQIYKHLTWYLRGSLDRLNYV